MQDEILLNYQVRKTNKQKTAFIEYIKDRLAKSGYDAEKDIHIEVKGKGGFMSRNIVVGDPKTAKVFFTAHYDTCPVLPFPNFMAPTNPVLFILSQMLMVAIMLGIVFGLTLFTMYLTNRAFNPSLIMLVYLYGFLFYMMFGFQNKHTANDNTSGTIAITHILEALPEEDRQKVCVVYFDNEEKGLFGSSFFFEKYKKVMNDKLLINLDCIGDGRDIVLLGKKTARADELYPVLVQSFENQESSFDVDFLSRNMKPMMFSSDQMHFEKGVGLCAVKKGIFGRYVGRIHTPFDTKCREENIKYITEAIKEFVVGIANNY